MTDLHDYWDNDCPVRGFYLMLGAGDGGSALATAIHSLVFLYLLGVCLLLSWPGGKAPPWTAWLVLLAVTVVVAGIGKVWRKKQAKKRRREQ